MTQKIIGKSWLFFEKAVGNYLFYLHVRFPSQKIFTEKLVATKKHTLITDETNFAEKIFNFHHIIGPRESSLYCPVYEHGMQIWMILKEFTVQILK